MMRAKPSLTIDRLTLRLPAGFEHRADAIARQVAARLAGMPWNASGRIERLSLAPVVCDPAEADVAIARRLSDAIAERISRHPQLSQQTAPESPESGTPGTVRTD